MGYVEFYKFYKLCDLVLSETNIAPSRSHSLLPPILPCKVILSQEVWGYFLMFGVWMLHFSKDWWKFIQIHQNYTMALKHLWNSISIVQFKWTGKRRGGGGVFTSFQFSKQAKNRLLQHKQMWVDLLVAGGGGGGGEWLSACKTWRHILCFQQY